MITTLIRNNRSCRRFRQDRPVAESTLRELVDLARCSPSAGNLQPLKYVLSAAPETNAAIFSCLGWAGYLPNWPGPAEGERPAAYVVILGDNRISAHIDCDHGIACQSILLGARERGLAGCIIGNIHRGRLAGHLGLGPDFRILLVLALGRPAEEARLEPLGDDGDVRYWRDPDGVHHVPKRCLEEILIAVR